MNIYLTQTSQCFIKTCFKDNILESQQVQLTNKKGGEVATYTLTAIILQAMPLGKVRYIQCRYDLPLLKISLASSYESIPLCINLATNDATTISIL
jgi:hypothetical protein